MPEFAVFATGLATSLSLIAAIGAQNAFVLRQGLFGRHVLAVVLACALSDALLIAIGVTGFSAAALSMPWLEPVMRFGGAAFLAWYGTRSMVSALRAKGALDRGGEQSPPALWPTLAACLAITWFNPHVYLDTIVLLGSISAQFADARTSFALGAISGSFLFFFILGFGATRLRPLFARPGTWRMLEGLIALVMWTIAASLIARV